MILCVNPNAAIDKTVQVENFHLNAIHRPSFELALPGGKGCNVARVAKALGQQPVVTGWVGGHAGRFIEEGLRAEGIGAAFVHTQVESRTCLSILDPSVGTMTEIYERGRPVTESELQAFYDLFGDWLQRVEMVTLSGSLPPGVPSDFYARLIHLANEAGVRTILDSSGEALRAGFEVGRPFMLKCNRSELCELAGEPLNELADFVRVAQVLAARQAACVVVTLGAAGAVAAADGRVWLAQSPVIQSVSAVGSGDAVLAGLACGLTSGQSFEDALRLGIAAGAANTLQVGAGRLARAEVDALYEQVKLASAF